QLVPEGNPDSEKVTVYSRALRVLEEELLRPGMTPVRNKARITIAMTATVAMAMPVFLESLPFRGAG
ncbi:MAG: hypothetical protein WAN87_08975, partial [Thermoplasmata archaeon]